MSNTERFKEGCAGCGVTSARKFRPITDTSRHGEVWGEPPQSAKCCHRCYDITRRGDASCARRLVEVRVIQHCRPRPNCQGFFLLWVTTGARGRDSIRHRAVQNVFPHASPFTMHPHAFPLIPDQERDDPSTPTRRARGRPALPKGGTEPRRLSAERAVRASTSPPSKRRRSSTGGAVPRGLDMDDTSQFKVELADVVELTGRTRAQKQAGMYQENAFSQELRVGLPRDDGDPLLLCAWWIEGVIARGISSGVMSASPSLTLLSTQMDSRMLCHSSMTSAGSSTMPTMPGVRPTWRLCAVQLVFRTCGELLGRSPSDASRVRLNRARPRRALLVRLCCECSINRQVGFFPTRRCLCWRMVELSR